MAYMTQYPINFTEDGDTTSEAIQKFIHEFEYIYTLLTNITGDADTVDGKHATAFQEVAEKDQPGGYAGLDVTGKIPGELLNITDPIWGSISGTLADQTDLQSALDGKQSVSEKDQPGGYVGLDANGKIDVALISPAMTGSATLNGTTDNTVQLTDIVTTLGLEVGDVIRIQYSGYDKLHTVESITDDNSIIVNYEHAGNRANGSLRLADVTANVTITRIAKWYNAPIGLGQAWVDVSAHRVVSTTYTNNTSRAIEWVNQSAPNTQQYIYINGNRMPQVGLAGTSSITYTLPMGTTYKVDSNTLANGWWELR